MSAVTAITSQYAIGEVLRNIESDSYRQAFEALTARTEIIRDADPRCIPAGVQLVFKDQPILAAAILEKVDYLITGDKAHFGHLYGNSVAGVEVIRPADFLTAQAYRLIP